MRRPDVFTLDYSHPLAQGCCYAALGSASGGVVDSSLLRCTAQHNSGSELKYADEIGRKSLYIPQNTSGILVPRNSLLNSAFTSISCSFFARADIAAIPMSLFSFGGKVRGELTITTGRAVRCFVGADDIHINGEGDFLPGSWYQFIFTRDASNLRGYYYGLYRDIDAIGTAITADSTDNWLGSVDGTTLNRQVEIADLMFWDRVISPAEIAILADRTDPMLGGLIVEERPVLYFDMGGSTDVTGTLSAIESGADTLDSAGSVLVSGAIASSESGGDTTSSSGVVLIQGTLSAAESGADTLVAYGGSAFPAISGEMDVAESGSDTFSASGSVVVTGSASVSEVTVDTISVIGQLLVSGLMDATEVGDDTYAELLAISASEVHRSVSLAAYSYVSVLPDEDYTVRA